MPSCIPCFKLIGTMEFQCVPASPSLNIRCIHDSSKNCNYNVFFLMEIRIPAEQHFLSCSVVVITRSFVTQHDCFFIFREKLNIWVPNCFNQATNKSAFTGIMKLCEGTRGDKNKSQLAMNLC